jgi:hypothetical protein
MDFSLEKIELLKLANKKLNIKDDSNEERSKNIIFIYTPPKVGSTSLASSLRLFGNHKYTIFHIHDELMIKVLYKIEDVTINEIIHYNKFIGKNVYVIDIYRSPIEKKMSHFFEEIDTFHFNTSLENINKFDINKLINRFNKIFPYYSSEEYFLNTYFISNAPPTFDYANKYILLEENGIKYIKLRLKDSEEWGRILGNIFKIQLKIIKEYESDKKDIKDLYNKFKFNYKIPGNILSDIENCEYLKYYYSPEERESYLKYWNNKKTNPVLTFTENEYNFYETITIENQSKNNILFDHYTDLGCSCDSCNQKRQTLALRILNGEKLIGSIVHETERKIINKPKGRFSIF